MTSQSDIETATAAIEVQADLHHQWFLGMQLMVSVRHGPAAVYDWIFRLFRAQHEAKFLSSFTKLGLDGLPHAVACARYHVLSNGIGGVPVEYTEEGPNKAWVRFRYPRWMFDGPVICGMPIEASRGFLNGWYAQNGVSLDNAALGFVCVSEDIGGWGLCGYFIEEDRPLAPGERLRFRPDERPPDFEPIAQPEPPGADWPAERLAKAKRNYAVDYIRNGLAALTEVLGRGAAVSIAAESARLTGLQRYRHAAALLGQNEGGAEGGASDGASGRTSRGATGAAHFLLAALRGMGDRVVISPQEGSAKIALAQDDLRIVRGLEGQQRQDLIACWIELWRGTVQSHREFIAMNAEAKDTGILWELWPEVR